MHFPIQLRRAGAITVATLAVVSAVYAFQRPFREYPTVEGYDKYPLPRDFKEKGEWTFGRLMYPPVGRMYGGFEMAGIVEGGRLQLDDGLSALRPPPVRRPCAA